jgi:hypothetical protein
MKLKQIALDILTIIIAFEYVGVTVMCVMYPSWAALIVNIVSAVACVMVVHQAYFYKYRPR